jgi:hypothetical protein
MGECIPKFTQKCGEKGATDRKTASSIKLLPRITGQHLYILHFQVKSDFLVAAHPPWDRPQHATPDTPKKMFHTMHHFIHQTLPMNMLHGISETRFSVWRWNSSGGHCREDLLSYRSLQLYSAKHLVGKSGWHGEWGLVFETDLWPCIWWRRQAPVLESRFRLTCLSEPQPPGPTITHELEGEGEVALESNRDATNQINKCFCQHVENKETK